MTFPEPLKERPSISSDTPIFRTSPVNSQCVLRLSMPEVPSNTCTTARFPDTSRTWPERSVPSPRRRLTISANWGSFTLSRITRGPFTPAMVLRGEGGRAEGGGRREGGGCERRCFVRVYATDMFMLPFQQAHDAAGGPDRTNASDARRRPWRGRIRCGAGAWARAPFGGAEGTVGSNARACSRAGTAAPPPSPSPSPPGWIQRRPTNLPPHQTPNAPRGDEPRPPPVFRHSR